MKYTHEYVREDLVPAYSGHEVAWGAWSRSSDRPLYTRGINACIGVAIYDERLRIGHMAHVLYDEQNQDEVLPPMLESIARDDSDPQDLHAFLSGGSYDDDSMWLFRQAVERRKRVIGYLGGLNIPAEQLTTAWNEDDVERVEMSLDVFEGGCIVRFITRKPYIPGQ